MFQELPKLPIPHRKGNDIVNLALMEIDPNKASDKSNMEINPMQKNEIIDIPNETRACQIRKNLSFYGRLTVKSFKANGKSKAAFAVHFENRKMIRLTKGYFDAETLMEKSRYKHIVKNITKWAIDNHNTEEKGIVTGSNTIKIINKRNFSSSEDNRDINLQKVISGRTRREFLKEQDRETTRESVKSTITLLTGTPVVYESVDEPVGSSSKVPSVDMNRKGLLQKELTLKIGCHNINRIKTNQQKFKTLGQWLDDEVFDIFAVTETNLNRKEGFFVGKKKKYLEGVDRISEFIIAARFYFRNMELIIIAIYIPPNNGSEMDK
ncbi:1022_t:CDS:2, partial [Gigaspora margarita]